MLCVGFLEETIFRGLPFTAIAKDNIKSAVIISSVTFGIGHIINLFNGSGMDLVNNLCRIVFAVAVGFPPGTFFIAAEVCCPVSPSIPRSTCSVHLQMTRTLPRKMQLLHLTALIVITVAYTLIPAKTPPKSGPAQIKMKKMKGNKNHEKYTV